MNEFDDAFNDRLITIFAKIANNQSITPLNSFEKNLLRYRELVTKSSEAMPEGPYHFFNKYKLNANLKDLIRFMIESAKYGLEKDAVEALEIAYKNDIKLSKDDLIQVLVDGQETPMAWSVELLGETVEPVEETYYYQKPSVDIDKMRRGL